MQALSRELGDRGHAATVEATLASGRRLILRTKSVSPPVRREDDTVPSTGVDSQAARLSGLTSKWRTAAVSHNRVVSERAELSTRRPIYLGGTQHAVLSGLSNKDLRARAKRAGASPGHLEGAADSERPKDALVALLLELQPTPDSVYAHGMASTEEAAQFQREEIELSSLSDEALIARADADLKASLQAKLVRAREEAMALCRKLETTSQAGMMGVETAASGELASQLSAALTISENGRSKPAGAGGEGASGASSDGPPDSERKESFGRETENELFASILEM
jgi:hypothetical protein